MKLYRHRKKRWFFCCS